MAVGPSKYDYLATYVMTRTKAKGCIVIVLQGEHGSGFASQLSPFDINMTPKMLRDVADTIEADMEKGEL